MWDDNILITKINHLCDYNKWKLGNGEKNPNADKVTGYILDIKDGPSASHFDKAKIFFAGKLMVALQKLSAEQLPEVIAIVPSSTKGKESPGLSEISVATIEMLKPKGINIQFLPNCLARTISVSKNSTGGNRSIEKHLSSIRVSEKNVVKGRRILLLDDVSTTGNSIQACKRILQQNGASDVIMLVLGQTVLENE